MTCLSSSLPKRLLRKMSEPTFPRKVYICSRQAAATSRSTSDFDISLSRNLVLPQKVAGFLTDIQLPHSWYTVDAGQRFLYFRIDSTDLATLYFNKIELSKGNYSGSGLLCFGCHFLFKGDSHCSTFFCFCFGDLKVSRCLIGL